VSNWRFLRWPFAPRPPGTGTGHVPAAGYKSLLAADPPPEFTFINPPFDLNSPTVSKYPPEVTGAFVLKALSRRLGWNSLAGKRLLDFGCGVRIARTIVNLGIEIGTYAGVDVNADTIGWLRSNVEDPRFRFERLDMYNPLYNPQGVAVDAGALKASGLADFDAACLLSVITHQGPEDARTIFRMLWQCIIPGGRLYFTAFHDDAVDGFVDRVPTTPCVSCFYNPDYLVGLAEECGWVVRKIYPASVLLQPAFVCDRK
jgi:SAM-dependent methyltransferase